MGLIDSTLLPSYVDDVLTYATLALFPVTGATGKIYVDESNGYAYRWTGSVYYCISTQSFYTKSELDTTLNTKLNLSGGTMSGNLALGGNNVSNVGTLTATTITPTNLSACTLTGTLTTGAQAIYGATGAVDVLHLKGLYLRSRDDAICATLDTGALILQNAMNANSKNITSISTASGTTATFTNVNPTTLGACTLGGALNAGTNNITSIGTASGTTATFTNVNATTLSSFTTLANTGHIYLGSSTFIYGSNGAIDVLNLKGTNLRDRNDTITATMESGALTLQTGMNANSKNISSIGTASGTTATFTNVNPTTLNGCDMAGAFLLASSAYIYGPSNNNTIHVQSLKGDILLAGVNALECAYLTSTGIQLQADLQGNTKNLNNCGKVSCASIAGTDGTVFATTTSNKLTLANTLNANSQNIDSVNQLNGLTYKGMKKYSTTGTTINGSNNLAITVDIGFTVVSFYATVDLRARTNDKFLVTSTSVDWTETIGTAGLGMVLTVLAIQS